MATYINTPRETAPSADNSATGVIVGVLLVVLLAILFLVFGLPYLRNRGTPAPAGNNINVTLPDTSLGGGTSGGGTTGGTGGTGATQ
jgi:flagellar biogenesis protein FliO